MDVIGRHDKFVQCDTGNALWERVPGFFHDGTYCRILKMRLTFLQANSDEVGPIRRIVIMTKPERSPVVKCGIIVLLVHAIFFPANIHIFPYDPNTSDALMCGKKDEQIPGRADATTLRPYTPKREKEGYVPDSHEFR